MSILQVFFFVLSLVLGLYTAILWARFFLDWITVINPRFRPKGIFAILIEIVFVLTDPPIKFFRKVIPPIRIGQVQLDLGWLITMVLLNIIRAFIPR